MSREKHPPGAEPSRNGKDPLAGIWRRSWPHLGPVVLPRWRLLVVAAVALLLNTAFDLLKPWPLKFVFDYLLEGVSLLPAWAVPSGVSETTITLLAICSMIVAIALISSTAAFLREFQLKRIGEEVSFELRVKLFSHLQRLGLAFHDTRRLGDTIERVTGDTRDVRTMATTSLLQVTTAVVTLVGMLAVMLSMNVRLALVGVFTIPVLAPTVWFFRRRIEGVSKERRKLEGEVTSVTQETMSSIRLVKSMGREAHQQRAFGRESSESAQVGLEEARLEAGYVRSVDFIAALATCAVVWFGVHLVWAKELLAGDLIVFAAYVKNLYGPLREVAKQSSRIAKGKVGLERIVEVLELEPEVTESPDAVSASDVHGRVQFQDVHFAYEPGKEVLTGVSFTAEPGEVVALVGPSGAGKSTILGLISRLYDPSSGRVGIDGRDLREYRIESLRGRISVVLQDSVLLQTTVLENVLYGRPDATEEEVIAAGEAACVDRFVDRLSDGYYTVVGPRGATLSGGERQRVAIARAIVRDAPILLLDEPTTGLDAESEQLVMEALGRLMRGRTTVLVSHDLDLIRRADRILVIDRGRIVEAGTESELLLAGGVYARLRAAADGELPVDDPALRPLRGRPSLR